MSDYSLALGLMTLTRVVCPTECIPDYIHIEYVGWLAAYPTKYFNKVESSSGSTLKMIFLCKDTMRLKINVMQNTQMESKALKLDQ